MQSVKMRAPAKINLTLEVGEKRSDGYHPLTSVMAHISLFDEITVSREGQGIEFESNAVYLRNDDKNLCTLAAKRFFEATGIKNEGVKIVLKKLIPSKSGMGGGSSDAAATLELMESLFGALDSKKRDEIALSLGADVPFCLTHTPALCEGIGEIITPVSLSRKRIYVVVAKNAQKLSTAQVYSDFDRSPIKFTGSHARVIKALETGKTGLFSGGICNVFEENVFSSSPAVKTLRDKMLSLGAYVAGMTGAGPTVFGLFEKKTDANRALEALREERILSYFAYII